MFQHKIDEIFRELHKVISTAEDILMVGYDVDGKDHDRTLEQVMQICSNENLKLNKYNYYFRCMRVPFWGDYSQTYYAAGPLQIACTLLTSHPTYKTLQSLFGFVNYLGTVSLATAEICKPLQRLTSAKADQTWNNKYQESYEKEKVIIKMIVHEVLQ